MYIGIDLGTSGIKTVLIDEHQHVVASRSAPLSVSRPHEGWSEQDPADWIAAISDTLLALKADHASEMAAVRGIGLSGQMHGATLLDAAHEVVRPCILWNDTRSHAQAARLDTDESRGVTGNILFPGFTAPKLAWVHEHEPANFERTTMVLLPKDYARFWLTGEFVADMSDAAGTGWLDVGARCWSPLLLEASGLSEHHMPHLVEGTAVSGRVRPSLAEQFGLSPTTIVAGGAGDNAASACGMGTVSPGSAFLSLGTSGVLFAANDAYRPNADSAVHTFCHAVPGAWHQMGVILAATDALNWWAGVCGSAPAELTAALGNDPGDATELLFLPYLGGERTPHNDAAARGVFVGLSHQHDRQAMTRAVLQGVSFAFRDCQAALASAGTTLTGAFAIGGGSRSAWWLQQLADCLQIPLQTAVDGDFGAGFGAARLGLIAAENAVVADVCTVPAVASEFTPAAARADAFGAEYERWRAAYRALQPLMQSTG